MSDVRIRRQVYELTPEDLERFPIWEFGLDEEGNEGQDEATVRPYEAMLPLDPFDGMFIVRATLRLADGSNFKGYLTPPVQGAEGLSTFQPTVVMPDGQVSFWCGMLVPPPEFIGKCYSMLGKASSQQVFPVHFQSDVPLVGGPIVGDIPGFLVLEDFETMRTRVVA